MLRSVSHTDSAQFPESNSEVENDIAEHWGWYLMLGIVLVIGGVAAIAFPLLSTIAAKHALGLIFFFRGRSLDRTWLFGGQLARPVLERGDREYLCCSGCVSRLPAACRCHDTDYAGGRSIHRRRRPPDHYSLSLAAPFALGLASVQRCIVPDRRCPDLVAASVFGNLGDWRSGRDQNGICGLRLHHASPRQPSAPRPDKHATAIVERSGAPILAV